MISGFKVSLRAAKESDRRQVYKWLACSDLTPSMMGPPDFPDHPVPTWEEFCSDYKAHYFDDSAIYSGRCFIITVAHEGVGVVSYNQINQNRRETELDIWLRSESDCGKGYGSDALKTLCDYLHTTYGIESFILRPSARNQRAIAAYQRAGFKLLSLSSGKQRAEYGPGDYVDTVVLCKHMST
ncbi:MAG: GNAT family protein [bacterium]